jgi:hypothetical protein
VLRKMNFATIPLASFDLAGVNQPHPADQPTILVVDDQAVIADTLGTILGINGYG